MFATFSKFQIEFRMFSKLKINFIIHILFVDEVKAEFIILIIYIIKNIKLYK
jgi:hypothetical protein